MFKDLIGVVLGERYEIQDLLGSGGMAWVFVAYDRILERKVAVKIVKPEFAWSSDIIEAFIKEIHITADLQHLHILTVHDCGTYAMGGNELPYLVMQLASGGTLLERVRRQPLKLGEADNILEQVCSALDYAHDRGVVHLDLKPSNILFNEQGDALVADFGLAKVFHATSHAAIRSLAGTLPYMPLEQWQGRPAGPLSDVYALGITLYEALTGELPKREWTEDGLLVHLEHSLPSLIQVVIERATQSDPNKRYGTAGELARALKAAVATSLPSPLWPGTEVPEGEPAPRPPKEQEEGQKKGPLAAKSPLPKRSWMLRAIGGLAALTIMVSMALLGQRWLEEQVRGMLVALLTSTPSPTVTATPTATPSLSSVLTPSAIITLTPTPSPEPYIVVPTERLRVYAGPDENHDVVDEVYRGDRLPLCGRSADGTWWQVDYLGKEGWIRAQPVGASVDPTVLPVVKAPPAPTRIPTPTEAEPTLPAHAEIPLQNPGFDGAYGDSIPGWESWALDNWSPDVKSPPDAYDTPFFSQTQDPARTINGPTFQIEATAFVKFKVYIHQIVSVQPNVVVRFQTLAKAYSALDGSGIKLAAGVDPNGGSDCSRALWGEELIANESDGVVRLASSDVTVGDAGRVTVCLYAEPLYPAHSNAAFLDDARLIANPE